MKIERCVGYCYCLAEGFSAFDLEKKEICNSPNKKKTLGNRKSATAQQF